MPKHRFFVLVFVLIFVCLSAVLTVEKTKTRTKTKRAFTVIHSKFAQNPKIEDQLSHTPFCPLGQILK